MLLATPHIVGQISVKFYRFEVNKLEPVKDVLGIYSVDQVHMTLVDLEVDELLLTQKRQVACGDGPSTFNKLNKQP